MKYLLMLLLCVPAFANAQLAVATAAPGNDTTYWMNQSRPDTLVLTGTRSTGAVSYSWTQIGGTALSIAGATSAATYATGTLAHGATYTFQLSINGGAKKDTIKYFARDFNKKNQTACRSGYDTTARTGGMNFTINPTETRNSGASVGWSIPYFNRDNYVATHGYPGQSIQGGDTLSFPGADSCYLFFIGDFGGAPGCPVVVVPKTKPIVFRSAKWQVGMADSNLVNYAVLDGTALRSAGYGYGFQVNNVDPARSLGYPHFMAYLASNFWVKGFWSRKVGTFQIKMNADSARTRPFARFDKFQQKKIKVTDFIVEGTSGEAFYLGNTDGDGTKSDNDHLAPPRMAGVEVYNGLVVDAGYDAVQISGGRDNCLVGNVLIINSGKSNVTDQRTAIELGFNTKGDIRRNIVLRSTGDAIHNFGYGTQNIVDNVIDSVFNGNYDNTGSAGFFQKSGKSAISYEVGDTALRTFNTGNIIGRVLKYNRYIRLENFSNTKTMGIGAITSNVLVNDSLGAVSNLLSNNAGATVSSNTLKTSFPIQYLGYKVLPGGYQFTLQQGDSTRSFLRVDDAVTWLKARAAGTSTANGLPTANAGSDQSITLPTASVILTGAGTDAEGTVTYLWTQDQGPAPATIVTPGSSNTVVSGLVQGTYVFKLSCTDLNGAVASDVMTVTVSGPATPPANTLPTVNAGADQTITLPVQTIEVQGTASDADGVIATYEWTQVGGANTAGIQAGEDGDVTFSFMIAGTYTFQLKVTDNGGGQATDRVTITVNPPAPVYQPNKTQRLRIKRSKS